MDKRTKKYLKQLNGLELSLEYSTLHTSEKELRSFIYNRIQMEGFCEDEEDADDAMIRILADAYRKLRDMCE
jgi:hypothetical protein